VNKRTFFAHERAIVEADEIGPETRIWAFAHIMPGVRIGAKCNIGDHCFLESGVVVGDEVVIKNGVAVWEGITFEDRVFVGPNCVFTNDIYPRSRVIRDRHKTVVRQGASIGANATILCGIEIGRDSLVGAGAVVTRNVPEFAIVAGNPARVQGYICRCGEKLKFSEDRQARCSCGLCYLLNKEEGLCVLVSAGVAS
jgi:acetyltransferase-like isoleucine patch superfamily enzyme